MAIDDSADEPTDSPAGETLDENDTAEPGDGGNHDVGNDETNLDSADEYDKHVVAFESVTIELTDIGGHDLPDDPDPDADQSAEPGPPTEYPDDADNAAVRQPGEESPAVQALELKSNLEGAADQGREIEQSTIAMTGLPPAVDTTQPEATVVPPDKPASPAATVGAVDAFILGTSMAFGGIGHRLSKSGRGEQTTPKEATDSGEDDQAQS